MSGNWGYFRAMEDFRRERNRGALQQVMAKLTGRPANLLSYDEVARKLRVAGGSDRGLQDIPIDAIIGSVSRYSDFTRGFFPRHDYDIDRWSRVKVAVSESQMGVPPIEVYKVGEAYFVKDGHHRVSVARSLGASHIQAQVNEIQTRVPLSADASPEELILSAEYAEFLSQTRLDILLPDADLRVTSPGAYRKLAEHIQVHQYFMGLDMKREIDYEEAVQHWYSEVYLPVRRAISEQGILRDFPGRTETDLYLWVSEHRYLLQRELGWEIPPERAVVDLTRQRATRAQRVLQRAVYGVLERFIPNQFELPPASGAWRRDKPENAPSLFRDVLIPISGQEAGWQAVEQSLVLANRENSRLNGLHVMAAQTEKVGSTGGEKDIRQEFQRRIDAAGATGALAVTDGEVSQEIIHWAALSDIVVLNVAYPPGTSFFSRMSSGLRQVIRMSVRPVLLIPGAVSGLGRLLLAYDGSPRAREALFVSAYLASKWGAPLSIICAGETIHTAEKTLNQARQYLEAQEITARYLARSGRPAGVIMQAAEEEVSELILMGSYGFAPLVEAVVGSTVDELLRVGTVPILVCQ